MTMTCAWPAVTSVRVKPKVTKPWRAVHLLEYNTDSDLEALGQNL